MRTPGILDRHVTLSEGPWQIIHRDGTRIIVKSDGTLVMDVSKCVFIMAQPPSQDELQANAPVTSKRLSPDSAEQKPQINSVTE